MRLSLPTHFDPWVWIVVGLCLVMVFGRMGASYPVRSVTDHRFTTKSRVVIASVPAALALVAIWMWTR